MAKADFYNSEDFSDLKNVKLAVVVSSFNRKITDRLLNGTLGFLSENGFNEGDVVIYRVPGAFEIPYVCERISLSKRYDAIITLGTVIRGETSHYDYVCTESARGIMDVSLRNQIPVSYGILTCENEQQAIERSGGNHGDKGRDAAYVVLDVLRLQKNNSI